MVLNSGGRNEHPALFFESAFIIDFISGCAGSSLRRRLFSSLGGRGGPSARGAGSPGLAAPAGPGSGAQAQ